jgi:hypothetical protein
MIEIEEESGHKVDDYTQKVCCSSLQQLLRGSQENYKQTIIVRR